MAISRSKANIVVLFKDLITKVIKDLEIQPVIMFLMIYHVFFDKNSATVV